MKKILPLLLFVLLAFAGCQREPVTYQETNDPREVAVNAEKFAKLTAKRSAHYAAEDWEAAIRQFTTMSKDYYCCRQDMTQEELSRFDAARLSFMQSVVKNGGDDLASKVKAVYAEVMGE